MRWVATCCPCLSRRVAFLSLFCHYDDEKEVTGMISLSAFDAEERLELLEEAIDRVVSARVLLQELDGGWEQDDQALGELLLSLEKERAAAEEEARRAARALRKAELAEFRLDVLEDLRAYR
jgi:hypothetical protein